MRCQTTAAFDRVLGKLPREHRRLFIEAVRDHFLPALNAGAHHVGVPWPTRLRVHKIDQMYSLTWSFTGPNGRALVTIGPDTHGEALLTWLAIGYPNIYP